MVKILQAVYNFVTYGNKDTLPMEDEVSGAEEEAEIEESKDM